MHRIREQRRPDGGFSLIELLVVVVIIGILAGIAIPIYMHETSSAHGSVALSDLRDAAQTEEAVATAGNPYTTTLATLAAQGFALSPGVVLSGAVNGSTAFCLVSTNVDDPGHYYLYDKIGSGLHQSSYSTLAAAEHDCSMSGPTWQAVH